MTHSPKPHGYALFDLDQTIVPWDTQLLFCNYVLKKRPHRIVYLIGFAPLAIFSKLFGAQIMKRIFMNYMAGMTDQDIDRYARDFVDQLVPDGLYPEIIELLEKHKNDGVLTILNSASPEIWVKYIAEKLGFDHYYGTQVDIPNKVRLFPVIRGSNNKGAAKIARMQAHFPTSWVDGEVLPNSYGYSDSHADLPMLMLCERNVMVNPTPKLKKYGERFGWLEMNPERPTKSKIAFAYACFRQAIGVY